MKTGRTLHEIALELERQNEQKKDYIADTRKLVATPTDGGFLLQGFNGGPLTVRDTAHEQIATNLGIPAPYYRRMREQTPDLLAANVNHWLQAQPAKRMVRTLDNGVRAFLSDRFRPLDNLDLAMAVLPKLGELGARVESSEITERRFYLKAVTDRVSGAVKVGDVIQAGIVVSNSEIGQGTLKLEELDFRLVCTNGMIRSHAVRQTHVGRRSGFSGDDLLEEAREFYRSETRLADDRAFFLKVQDATALTFNPDRFAKRIEEYKQASERKIESDPVEVVEVMTKRFGLAEGESRGILKHLIQGGDLSAWGLGNAVTRASQDVEDYERATVLEAVGGEIIELPTSAFAAAQKAKKVEPVAPAVASMF